MWITELCKPFLISNLMNIKQDQLNYYCYTGMLPTCRPVLPAALLLVKTRQQQSPSMNAFTDNDSGFFLILFIFQTTNTSNGQQRKTRYSFWPFRAPHTNRPCKLKAFTLSLSLHSMMMTSLLAVSREKKENSSAACERERERREIKKSRGVSGVSERAMNHVDVPGWASPAGRQQRPLSWTTAEGPGARCFFPNLGPGGATPGVVGESQVVAYYRLLHQRHWHPCRVGPAVVIFRSHGIWSVTYWNEWKCRSEFFTLWQEINGPFPSFFKWFRLAWTVRSNHQSYSFCTVILQYMWIQ